MNAGQVIELASEWVAANARPTPGFLGAHLMGALAWMPKEAPFPNYKDVDLHIVLEEAVPSEPRELDYCGLILECAVASAERYRPPEKALADPFLAANLAADSILDDPTGFLTMTHARVAQEYAQRRWVAARCEAEKAEAMSGLVALQQAKSLVEAQWALLPLAIGLTGLVAVASLQPPTHRRALILMRDLLSPLGRIDLQEDLLALFGAAQLSRAEVESALLVVAEAFDRAVQVTRTPVPMGFKLHPHVRPYVVEASQEMIAAGYHREAMAWILSFLLITQASLQADAPANEKPYFAARANAILGWIGWDTLDHLPQRVQQAQQLVNEVFRVADNLVIRNTQEI